MTKYCIVSALKPELDSSGKRISQCESKVQFVFSSEKLEHASKHGNLITFDCYGFSVDEENSSKNWKDVFNFNEEPPRRVVITVDIAYKAGIVLPYVD